MLQLKYALSVLPLLLIATLYTTVAATSVSITIKAGSIESIEPSQLYSDMDYLISVKVLDENGDPVSGASVEFRTASALIAIENSSKATTDQHGIATLNIRFTAGGVLNLYVDGTKVGTLIINYKSFPSGALAFIICTFVIVGTALSYMIYKGPYKSLRKS
jgi:hypothetical protein